MMIKYLNRTTFVILLWIVCAANAWGQMNQSLNGRWEMGEGRAYNRVVDVPGIHCNPTQMNRDTLWYRRVVSLPDGKWQYATLELKGARFSPTVFVNGQLTSFEEGGMAPTFHLLRHSDVRPGNNIVLEVALVSLSKLPKTDASYIAVSDHWRSNVSSCLWDDVVLHLHGSDHIVNMIPDADTEHKNIDISFFVENVDDQGCGGQYLMEIADRDGKCLLSQSGNYQMGKNMASFNYDGKLKEWTPETPHLYNVTITLKTDQKVSDRITRKLGVKRLEIRDKQFFLNGCPYKLRGGSITWHRWMRSPEGPVLGYDTKWFGNQVLQRMKDYGANEVNFHLGLAPTRLLDLCDEMGILVRYEWSFFHGMPASEESCRRQYARWLASSMEHPSAAYYYPYNETSGEELKRAWSALGDVLKDYPHLVIAHRDVMHLHKYWWSIFENLGVYYDSYEQFDQAVMADEFGGNYLDKNGDYGGYPSVKESFLRFCGDNNTKEQRQHQQVLSTGKIAEYWRRVGVAGWTPYTIISSYEDGNSWFMGEMVEANPMPVWQSMAAAWSPQAVSMDIWDVNYIVGQTVHVPLHFFNDAEDDKEMLIEMSVCGPNDVCFYKTKLSVNVGSFSHLVDTVTVTLPEETGNYTLRAELMNRPEKVKYRVASEWGIRVFKSVVPVGISGARIFVPDEEQELVGMLDQQGLARTAKINDADVIVLSSCSWAHLVTGDDGVRALIENAINRGVSVVMLDVGPQSLGKGYPVEGESLKSLLNPPSVTNPKLYDYPLFGSIVFRFKEAAESETNIFPNNKDDSLWAHLPSDYRGMWNGLRGNLSVPAWEMEVQGVNADLFLEQWTGRGADEAIIRAGKPYYAYELHGYYAYSDKADDIETEQILKALVKQRIEDAPSLAVFINPNIPIKMTDVATGYKKANSGMAKSMSRMVTAGKNLTKVPVFKIEFGEGKGNLLVSQLLTSGRLTEHKGKVYDRRYDETAVQMVLNMIEQVIDYGK